MFVRNSMSDAVDDPKDPKEDEEYPYVVVLVLHVPLLFAMYFAIEANMLHCDIGVNISDIGVRMMLEVMLIHPPPGRVTSKTSSYKTLQHVPQWPTFNQ